MRAIRLDRLTAELPAAEALAALAVAMTELGIAQALVMIHGPELGMRRYAEVGGHARFDADGEPVLLWEEKKRRGRTPV